MHLLVFRRGSLLITYQEPKHLAITHRFFFSLSSSFSTDDFLNAPACETRREHRGETLQIQILISVCWQIDPSGEHLQKSSPRPKTLQRCSRLGREASLPA